MKTLKELVEFTKEAAEAFEKQQTEHQQMYEEAVALKKKAIRDRESALSCGDADLYARATEAEKYNTERARILHMTVLRPYFSMEENNQLVAEVKAAVGAEALPHYEHLLALMDEWRETVDKLKAVYNARRACNRYLSMTKSRKNAYPDGYDDLFTSYMPSCLDLFKPDSRERFEVVQNCKAYRAR